MKTAQDWTSKTAKLFDPVYIKYAGVKYNVYERSDLFVLADALQQSDNSSHAKVGLYMQCLLTIETGPKDYYYAPLLTLEDFIDHPLATIAWNIVRYMSSPRSRRYLSVVLRETHYFLNIN